MRLLLVFMLTSAAHALDWQPLTLSGREGVYSIEAWKRDWPECEFEDGITEGRVSLVKTDGVRGCGSPAPLGRCESGLLRSGSALAGGRWGRASHLEVLCGGGPAWKHRRWPWRLSIDLSWILGVW